MHPHIYRSELDVVNAPSELWFAYRVCLPGRMRISDIYLSRQR